jgi:hypothetical protein
MDLIGRLWQDSPLFLTRAEFEKSLEGWTLDPVYGADMNMVGVFLVNGPKFHFSKFDPSYQAGRDILRKYPGSLIAKYGYALTSTPKEDVRQRRFNERLGFFQVGEDEFDIHYKIDKLRVKERPCQ